MHEALRHGRDLDAGTAAGKPNATVSVPRVEQFLHEGKVQALPQEENSQLAASTLTFLCVNPTSA
eukprot:758631-Hanusia_phi.AAC.1